MTQPRMQGMFVWLSASMVIKAVGPIKFCVLVVIKSPLLTKIELSMAAFSSKRICSYPNVDRLQLAM